MSRPKKKFLFKKSILVIIFYREGLQATKTRVQATLNLKTSGVHIFPFSIPFGIDKFERNGGKFLNTESLHKNYSGQRVC